LGGRRLRWVSSSDGPFCNTRRSHETTILASLWGKFPRLSPFSVCRIIRRAYKNYQPYQVVTSQFSALCQDESVPPAPLRGIVQTARIRKVRRERPRELILPVGSATMRLVPRAGASP